LLSFSRFVFSDAHRCFRFLDAKRKIFPFLKNSQRVLTFGNASYKIKATFYSSRSTARRREHTQSRRRVLVRLVFEQKSGLPRFFQFNFIDYDSFNAA